MRPSSTQDHPTAGKHQFPRAEKIFLLVILAFCACALVLATVNEMNWPLEETFGSYWVRMAILLSVGVPVLALLTARGRMSREALSDRARQTGLFLALIPFLISFSQIKTLIYRFPGWNFDPEQAALDRFLHLGRDAWEVYFPILSVISFDAASYAYHGLWAAPLLLGPALALAIDRDRARVRAGMACYLFIWIVLGIVVAAVFYSVGPAFTGILLNDADRFALLFASIEPLGFHDSVFAFSVEMLAIQRQAGELVTGLGISAFPSIHVAMATLTALYLGSTSRWLIVPAWLYLAVIQAFSVLSGLHYAIDGYAAFLLTLAFWIYLRRRIFISPTASDKN